MGGSAFDIVQDASGKYVNGVSLNNGNPLTLGIVGTPTLEINANQQDNYVLCPESSIFGLQICNQLYVHLVVDAIFHFFLFMFSIYVTSWLSIPCFCAPFCAPPFSGIVTRTTWGANRADRFTSQILKPIYSKDQYPPVFGTL